ncbi:DUF1766-domain-containing protein [Sodiomyces alkalinus F11]|uniref:DUF1766-domain-containing protein n=1 Tax=Sodiomyces alkalinus (strain CBS 110278 / VKM F-3762 / F11) TaxID=1314773 RepID=A0A3N2Q1Z1_SODAK|nr:DUF1766-domain-containing protein [Sodiomyces alkalinus F11]ROT40783.1 DUF1766-domain-containing protein [Sodiomyces alkalinus F11]
MPFVPNTPESLVARSDSKNPRTTCRGLTANGRPCRRPIASSVSPTENLAPRVRKNGVFDDDPTDESLYCWQHKEQASLSARSTPARKTATISPIAEDRTSLDSLVGRLGLVELQKKKRSSGTGTIRRHDKRPGPNYDDDKTIATSTATHDDSKPSPTINRPKQSTRHLLCCCFSIPLEEIPESPAAAPRPARPGSRPITPSRRPRPRPQPRPVQDTTHLASLTSPPNLSTQSPGRSSLKSTTSTTSQTAQYFSLIAPDTPPQTASSLIAELARPYADSEEPGYIYMFWMTPSSAPARPPVDAARSLLAPPSLSGPSSPGAAATSRQRRASDIVSTYARNTNGGGDNGKPRTMLLKIGRAANVQRRMQQWSRQCGYDVEVIRYYPYLAGASEAAGRTPRMTPHCRRVERLVHIELAGRGFKARRPSCEACGRDHREWFEVEATREGIRTVDEVVRRWVDWDERGSD